MRVLNRPRDRNARRSTPVLISLSALALGGTALAQSTTTALPASPVTTQPPLSSPLPPTGRLAPPAVNVSPTLIVGRWSHVRTDAETRSHDVVTIEFLADGRYLAQNRNSVLPTPGKTSMGRYSISNVQGNTFDLRIERMLAEPLSDPQGAFAVQRITVVDSNTLRAADGSVVQRSKE